jgi:hypothetical protein
VPVHRSRTLPHFLIAGAPKAGSSALHAALAAHPQLFLSDPKEPKYFLCGNRPPPLYTGPGDAHSRREWVWRRDDYESLFAGAPRGAVLGESTPFYLADRDAHQRIHDLVPDVRIVVVLRDPVDRAYSNWMHLWADGLEPESDFLAAVRAEDARVGAGWAPFWQYRGLGRYGEQLAALRALFPADQVHLVRYRALVDEPAKTLDAVCEFLGVDVAMVAGVPRDNTRPFVPDGPRRRVLARVVRGGAGAGAFFKPQLWRRASRPLLRAMHGGRSTPRPALTARQRREVLEPLLPDIARLEDVTGESFDDWRGSHGRGSFAERSAATS